MFIADANPMPVALLTIVGIIFMCAPGVGAVKSMAMFVGLQNTDFPQSTCMKSTISSMDFVNHFDKVLQTHPLQCSMPAAARLVKCHDKWATKKSSSGVSKENDASLASCVFNDAVNKPSLLTNLRNCCTLDQHATAMSLSGKLGQKNDLPAKCSSKAMEIDGDITQGIAKAAACSVGRMAQLVHRFIEWQEKSKQDTGRMVTPALEQEIIKREEALLKCVEATAQLIHRCCNGEDTKTETLAADCAKSLVHQPVGMDID